MPVNEKSSLIDLFRYNQWANERVFGVCERLDPALHTETAAGANGSIENTLSHLMGVEDAYLAMIRGQPLSVPWIKAPLTARDGLLQVLTHSGQHRAQVFSVLGARGIDVPGLDYVMMLEETKGAGWG
ncbi:MAG: DinB family protein [Chloroflexota bacterium]